MVKYKERYDDIIGKVSSYCEENNVNYNKMIDSVGSSEFISLINLLIKKKIITYAEMENEAIRDMNKRFDFLKSLPKDELKFLIGEDEI